MFDVEVNIVPVLVSAIAAMVIGAVWYSNSVFGADWRKLVGWDEKSEAVAKKKMIITFGVSALAFTAMAYVLAHVIAFIDATTTFEGVQAGFLMWIGFVATSMLINILYQGKQLKLFFIDSFYMLLVLIAMGAILVLI